MTLASVSLKGAFVVSFQTFEDFKNDKQALEYQQRIVDILLQVKSQKQFNVLLEVKTSRITERSSVLWTLTAWLAEGLHVNTVSDLVPVIGDKNHCYLYKRCVLLVT